MQPVVAIVSPGNMGAAVARRLTRYGVSVLTTLTGRSTASAARATTAGMTAMPMERLVDADFLLSILPPAAAALFAEQMAPLLRMAHRKPVFVDCNAVSPRTVQRIAASVVATGTPFVDGGIIGLPSESGPDGPRFYASGDHAARFQMLADYGLDIRVIDGPIGAASALKLSFAGINKGITAIATAMILAAIRAGAAEGLRRELVERWPALLASFSRQVPDMVPKSYRWVTEMQEIAEFVGEDPAARDIFIGASCLYDRLSHDAAGGGRESLALSQFFADEIRPRCPP